MKSFRLKAVITINVTVMVTWLGVLLLLAKIGLMLI